MQVNSCSTHTHTQHNTTHTHTHTHNTPLQYVHVHVHVSHLPSSSPPLPGQWGPADCSQATAQTQSYRAKHMVWQRKEREYREEGETEVPGVDIIAEHTTVSRQVWLQFSEREGKSYKPDTATPRDMHSPPPQGTDHGLQPAEPGTERLPPSPPDHCCLRKRTPSHDEWGGRVPSSLENLSRAELSLCPSLPLPLTW